MLFGLIHFTVEASAFVRHIQTVVAAVFIQAVFAIRPFIVCVYVDIFAVYAEHY